MVRGLQDMLDNVRTRRELVLDARAPERFKGAGALQSRHRCLSCTFPTAARQWLSRDQACAQATSPAQ
jgi:hypothetical protein